MTEQKQNETTKARWGAAIVAIAPAVLLAGFVYHPQIGNFTDPGFLAALSAAVAADPTRWYFSHLTIAVGSGLLVLAFLAIRSYLREAGEERWSVLALPFIVIGSTLFVMPPTFEISTLAAAEAGADVQAFQAALIPRVVPSLLTGAALFALGAIGLLGQRRGAVVLVTVVGGPFRARLVRSSVFRRAIGQRRAALRALRTNLPSWASRIGAAPQVSRSR